MNKTAHLLLGVVFGGVSLFCGLAGLFCFFGSYMQFNVLVIFCGLLMLIAGFFALRSFARAFRHPPKEQKPSVCASASETQHLTGATPDERLAPLVKKT
jgi:uncharacterized membrane protein HdeD (DUF308 family)